MSDLAIATTHLYIDSRFSIASYDVIAKYPETDTVSIAGFEVARLGFREMLMQFRSALDMHAQSGMMFAFGDTTIAATLRQASEQYLALAC